MTRSKGLFAATHATLTLWSVGAALIEGVGDEHLRVEKSRTREVRAEEGRRRERKGGAREGVGARKVSEGAWRVDATFFDVCANRNSSPEKQVDRGTH